MLLHIIGLGATWWSLLCQYHLLPVQVSHPVQLIPTLKDIRHYIGYSYRLSECTRIDIEGHENPKISWGSMPPDPPSLWRALPATNNRMPACDFIAQPLHNKNPRSAPDAVMCSNHSADRIHYSIALKRSKEIGNRQTNRVL